MSVTGSAKFYLRSVASLLAVSSAAFLAPSPAAEAADPTIDVAVTPAATQMSDAVNAVRGAMNLPALTVDSRLCAAAGGHAAYLTRNHIVSHQEDATLPGYTAATAAGRANAHGYTGECYESVSQGTLGPTAVRRLFDAPYHRAPFLQPGTFDVGSAEQSDIVTLMFGVTATSGVVAYPYDGQKNVPTTWDTVEMPNPLRIHPGAGSQTGYAISLYRFSPDQARLIVTSATLTTTDGKEVPAYLNTSENDDHLQNGALLIPQHPLQHGTTYRVCVEAKDSNGADCSKVWTFTTATASSAPQYVASVKSQTRLASVKH